MMIDNVVYRWFQSARGPRHLIAQSVVFFVLLLAIALGCVMFGVYLMGAAFAALSLSVVTVFVRSAPRVAVSESGVEVQPLRPLANPNWVFTSVAFVAAVLITLQPIVGRSMGDDLRYTVILIAIWVAAVVALGSSLKQRGRLIVNSESIAIGTHPAVLLQDVQLTILQARKNAIPHLQLVDASGKNKKRLIFPQKYYGLDADSVYSTVRHLAETEVEIRRAYSPELIREMLLFKPDHEVVVGDSIEVRVVARPAATTP